MKNNYLQIILILIIITIFIFNNTCWIQKLQNSLPIRQYFFNSPKNFYNQSTIWLLWFQGWDNPPWLQNEVAKSWKLNNPTWNIQLLDMNNLKDFINDSDYLFDDNKDISMQAKSDIIRLSLLKNHGGVWADSTLLCMQPLDSWVYSAIEPSNFWMYHGEGGGMNIMEGPASWFIVSVKNSYIINKWKEECDEYWNSNDSTDNYFWMDSLFKKLYENDQKFKQDWDKVAYLSCEDPGSSHTLANYDAFDNTQFIKDLFTEKPPFVLKYWKHLNDRLSACENNDECIESNGYHAIQMAKRKFVYKHF